MTTSTTKIVRLSTTNNGTFSTHGVVKARNGRVVHTTEAVPYRNTEMALRAAREWAEAHGYTVAD